MRTPLRENWTINDSRMSKIIRVGSWKRCVNIKIITCSCTEWRTDLNRYPILSYNTNEYYNILTHAYIYIHMGYTHRQTSMKQTMRHIIITHLKHMKIHTNLLMYLQVQNTLKSIKYADCYIWKHMIVEYELLLVSVKFVLKT